MRQSEKYSITMKVMLFQPGLSCVISDMLLFDYNLVKCEMLLVAEIEALSLATHECYFSQDLVMNEELIFKILDLNVTTTRKNTYRKVRLRVTAIGCLMLNSL